MRLAMLVWNTVTDMAMDEEEKIMNRRKFLAAGGAFGAFAVVPRAIAQWRPSQRYPDPL